MRYSFRSVFTLLMLAFAMTQFSYAQNDSPVFSVAYIEVTPASTEQAMSLLKAHAEESRAQDAGGYLTLRPPPSSGISCPSSRQAIRVIFFPRWPSFRRISGEWSCSSCIQALDRTATTSTPS